MQAPDARPIDLDATRVAVKSILDCREVRRATRALARCLVPAAGMANASAWRAGTRARRLGSQSAVFPSPKAVPALVSDEVVEPPEHIRHAAGAVHPAAEHGQDLPEDVLLELAESMQRVTVRAQLSPRQLLRARPCSDCTPFREYRSTCAVRQSSLRESKATPCTSSSRDSWRSVTLCASSN